MKQVWISKAGGPEVLKIQDAPKPIPGNGEVRIQVTAAGINFADILGRMGMYPDAPSIPYVPGYEVSGVVDAVGQGVTDLREGDRAFALTRFNGYSSAVCVPHKQVFKAFDWLNDDDAAALPVNYLTAYISLLVMGSLRPGDRVLIHGAAGGVGLAALDICKIMGAETFGTASLSKHEFLVERGLHHPIDYRNPDQDYERVIESLTAGKGVHLILDSLGGVHWQKNYRLLAPTGRLVHFGASSMASGKKRSLLSIIRAMLVQPRYTPLKLMSDNKAVIGVNLGHLWDQGESMRGWMEQILSWYDELAFRPHIDRKFSFAEAAA
ncbi:MAG: zinc-binding dehydrogenase, partial [Anaerolineales bacterium]|nr:zinc-binding dehydrogenase [Anaerolineales bacterium]